MSFWNLGSSDNTFVLSLEAVDENGNIVSPPSMAWYQGAAFPVTGRWVASAPGRAVNSAFSFSGETPPPNPLFLSAGGIMVGPGPSPTSITIYVTQVSSVDKSKVEWSGDLSPNATFPAAAGSWTVSEGTTSLGVLQLSLANGQQLSAAATWTPTGGAAQAVGVTWINSRLGWWAGGTLYESGQLSGSSFSGSYKGPKRQDGTWTASQGK
jgi:hypothetical protein